MLWKVHRYDISSISSFQSFVSYTEDRTCNRDYTLIYHEILLLARRHIWSCTQVAYPQKDNLFYECCRRWRRCVLNELNSIISEDGNRKTMESSMNRIPLFPELMSHTSTISFTEQSNHTHISVHSRRSPC